MKGPWPELLALIVAVLLWRIGRRAPTNAPSRSAQPILPSVGAGVPTSRPRNRTSTSSKSHMNDRRAYLWGGVALFMVMSVLGAFAMLNSAARIPLTPEWRIEGADVQRGREVIAAYGCGSCHVVPGVREARGRVGPRLDDLTERAFIAGTLSNTPENLALWIQYPQRVDPRTAMPNLGVNDQDAQDIAAYLYSLK